MQLAPGPFFFEVTCCDVTVLPMCYSVVLFVDIKITFPLLLMMMLWLQLSSLCIY